MTSTPPTTTHVDFSHMTRDELVLFRRHLMGLLRMLDLLMGAK